MNLKYIEVDNNNLDLAVKIQNNLFPLEDGRQNYVEGINNDSYRKEMVNYIVYDNEIPIGVVGLYSYNEYPNDAWLSWFGVLENYRQKGYGSKMFDFFEKLALNKGYTSIRVYTDNEFDKAILLYEKKEMIKELKHSFLEIHLICHSQRPMRFACIIQHPARFAKSLHRNKIFYSLIPRHVSVGIIVHNKNRCLYFIHIEQWRIVPILARHIPRSSTNSALCMLILEGTSQT